VPGVIWQMSPEAAGSAPVSRSRYAAWMRSAPVTVTRSSHGATSLEGRER
jgi:hypothetical protein